MNPSRILIYRLGSLGDTIVALPAFHLIAQAFPNAERWVLTNFNKDSRAAPMAEVLANTGLVDGYLRYSLGMRAPWSFARLKREIRSFHPDALVYLAEPRGGWRVRRDAAFFRWCGIPRLVGIPYTRDLQQSRLLDSGIFEYEGSRLLRGLQELGKINLDGEEAFNLHLTEKERTAALAALADLPADAPFLVASIGAKVDVNDWGDPNWSVLLRRLGQRLSGWSLVMIGSAVEHGRSDKLLGAWGGRALNLCGALSVRTSGAVLERARLFVGHDSGPMHLAAAVGTPCVAIFSSRNLPGEWFPHGNQHRVIYRDVSCRGCRLAVCSRYGKKCIASISPTDVIGQIELVISEHDSPGQPPLAERDSAESTTNVRLKN